VKPNASQPSSKLTTIQQCVVNALAAGATLTNAAEQYGVHRVTVYRWMKTHKEFTIALRQAQADFVLARRDALFHLSTRAMETLLAILDNPKSSPAVLFKTAAFILQRPQQPNAGWSMPEPAPDPDDNKLLDSAVIEQDYAHLPGLYSIAMDPPMEEDAHAESVASDPPPSPDVSPCNTVQQDPANSAGVTPHDLRSGDGVPPATPRSTPQHRMPTG
jgi:hypothetical protein